MAKTTTTLHTISSVRPSHFVCPRCSTALLRDGRFTRTITSNAQGIVDAAKLNSSRDPSKQDSVADSARKIGRLWRAESALQACSRTRASTRRTTNEHLVLHHATRPKRPSLDTLRSASHTCPRHIHASHLVRADLTLIESPPSSSTLSFVNLRWQKAHGIRGRLRDWQAESAEDTSAAKTGLDFGQGVMGTAVPLPKENSHTNLEDSKDSLASQALQDDQTDGLLANRFIDVGDLVHIQGALAGSAIVAVKVRVYTTSSIFLTADGRWLEVSDRLIPFKIANWVNTESLQALQSHIPSSKFDNSASSPPSHTQSETPIEVAAPRDITGPLVSRMKDLVEQARKVYLEHSAVLDNAYELLAHQHDLRFGTLTSITASLLNHTRASITPDMLLAVHEVIMRHEIQFTVDHAAARMSGYIQIRPKAEVSRIAQVVSWVRQWQHDTALGLHRSREKRTTLHTQRGTEVIEGFINKARAIVQRSRETRSPTSSGCIGPSTMVHNPGSKQSLIEVKIGENFSPSEQKIIAMIEAWASTRMFAYATTLRALPSLLIEATGLYKDMDEGLRDHQVAYLFLQELGVVMPYHAHVKDDVHLLLPTSNHSKPLQRLAKVIENTESGENFKDTMSHLRHDWGELPVYCIDETNTFDIDDGISIEPGPNNATDDDWWVHTHIANPSAYLARESPLVAMARHVTESWYMPDDHIGMFPSWAKQAHWSLANGRPCLTLSALVDNMGDVIDTQARLGVVSNVIHLTPEIVSEAVQGKTTNASTTVTVGGMPPPLSEVNRTRLSTMNQSIRLDLEILDRIARRRTELRRRNGAEALSYSQPNLQVWLNRDKDQPPAPAVHRTSARSISGDPIIMATFYPTTKFVLGDSIRRRSIVQEIMLLAGEAASRWATARDIPLMNRGTRAPRHTPEQIASVQAFREAAITRHGGLPRHLDAGIGKPFSNVVYSTRSMPHNVLGLDAYCKITSPMRRYVDLVNHWQIQTALSHEAKESQTQLGPHTPINQTVLPYDENALQTLSNYVTPRELTSRRFMSDMRAHWLHMLLFRAHHFEQAVLPATFTATNMSPNTTRSRIFHLYVHELGTTLAAKYDVPPEDFNFGDIWEIVLSNVNVYHTVLTVRNIRLLKRFD